MNPRHAFATETRSSFARVRSVIGWMLLVVVVGAALTVALATTVGGYHATRVLSNSMQPAFSAGDLVIVRDAPVTAIEKGDVVVLPDPNSSSMFIHRLTSVDRAAGHTTVTTRGDNNPAPDAWLLDVTSKTVPAYVAVIPIHGLHLPVLPQATSQLLLAAGLGIVALLIGLPSGPRPARAALADAR
ncbi:signal peptidase I [Tessaracoccus antarcticus]|uniref:Signal peptidase I n=1 Tax=Tessaracoccus antarcticus TaxID=2479848 RepID=A0A3M0GVI5_9ACTN|nr:signal peptidase I [Tessaracoccus antarcticus]RMB61346.1 signal peptidase I [Tessaracoccus antarcticus]